MRVFEGEDVLYSVWVGGGEVNDYLLTKDKAEELANAWIRRGYDDVIIQRIEIRPGGR